jgi:hypothetical protein
MCSIQTPMWATVDAGHHPPLPLVLLGLPVHGDHAVRGGPPAEEEGLGHRLTTVMEMRIQAPHLLEGLSLGLNSWTWVVECPSLRRKSKTLHLALTQMLAMKLMW